MSAEFDRNPNDGRREMTMDVHNEDLDDENAYRQRQTTIMPTRYGLTLRIVFLLPGCDRCAMPETEPDHAETGQGADADDVGFELVISLHRSDFGTVGHRLMTPLIFDSCITMPKQARLSWTPLFVSGWVT